MAADDLFSPLDAFERVSLEETGSVSFLDRVDRKFLLSVPKAAGVLRELRSTSRVLEVADHRFSPYTTVYFDSPDFMLYKAHHGGRANRFKIRSRRYGSNGAVFHELKHKTNKGRTRKSRITASELGYELDDTFEEFIAPRFPIPSSGLSFALEIGFSRATLVDKALTERVTIDTGLSFTRGSRTFHLPDLVIVEIKRERHGRYPNTETLLRRHGIRRSRCSKYCLGIVSLGLSDKTNNFKELLRTIEKCQSSPSTN